MSIGLCFWGETYHSVLSPFLLHYVFNFHLLFCQLLWAEQAHLKSLFKTEIGSVYLGGDSSSTYMFPSVLGASPTA